LLPGVIEVLWKGLWDGAILLTSYFSQLTKNWKTQQRWLERGATRDRR
jgi:hypothetical protein